MPQANPQPRQLERRSGHDRRDLTPAEKDCLRYCRIAGALFIGIQPGFGEIGDQCLFQAGPIATTLCLPVQDLTPLAILVRLQDSRKRYLKALEMHFPTATSKLAMRA